MLPLPLLLLAMIAAQPTGPATPAGQAPAQSTGFDTDVTVPTNAHPMLQAKAEGVQIYTCSPQGLSFGWLYKAPEATLTDLAGQPVGTHGAGPVWTAADGTVVRGVVIAQKVAQDPLSVPWLLLSATPVPGKSGTFSSIAFVRRSETRGGVAPVDGCDAAHAGTDVRVPYSATYTFYRPDAK